MSSIKEISLVPFTQWLLHDKENKVLFFLSVLIQTISFLVLKLLYPFPNFMPPDSYSYLDAAYNNDLINIWPIGYSKFLRLISCLSNSHLFLVIIQHLILEVCLMYFLYTIRYMLSLNKWEGRILFAICVINPLLPHIANFVSSDCLFSSLSLIWFTQLFWIIYRPTQKLILLHAIVLLLAFMVRYYALYYPFISFTILLFSSLSKRNKWIGIGSISFFILSFIVCTQNEYRAKTDTVQYSAFGGWQLAANALYGYAYSQTTNPELIPKKYRELHAMVNRHIDSLKRLTVRPDGEIGIYYLWDFKSPLRKYMEYRWKTDSTTPYFKKWASMAPLYSSYGRYLIINHPNSYLKHFAWPNLQRYYAPPGFFMSIYNLGSDFVDPIVVKWFGLTSNKLSTYNADKTIRIADIFTIVTAVINLIFVSSIIAFILLGGYSMWCKHSNQILICTVITWIGNTVFSVLSAPIELRYQLFPLIITLTWGLVLIFYIVQQVYSNSNKVSVSLEVQ